LIIIIVQGAFWFYRRSPGAASHTLQLDKEVQAKIDALKEETKERDSLVVFPFNPNFISDYKGYTLGMSIEEIDRLHKFREQNKFINNTKEFQEVTGVSDSLLNRLSPYFKFPEWAKNTGNIERNTKVIAKSKRPLDIQLKDLNQVTVQELTEIRGIGKVLSQRIIKFRDRLGGFLLDDQLYDVFGLEPEVAERVLEKYKVLKAPEIEKVNINTASARELSKIGYISTSLAEGIVRFREENGEITSFDELRQIESFPTNRINRFPLYLSLKK
jgi:competence ComEA-like helix-hairpin-helix protein